MISAVITIYARTHVIAWTHGSFPWMEGNTPNLDRLSEGVSILIMLMVSILYVHLRALPCSLGNIPISTVLPIIKPTSPWCGHLRTCHAAGLDGLFINGIRASRRSTRPWWCPNFLHKANISELLQNIGSLLCGASNFNPKSAQSIVINVTIFLSGANQSIYRTTDGSPHKNPAHTKNRPKYLQLPLQFLTIAVYSSGLQVEK